MEPEQGPNYDRITHDFKHHPPTGGKVAKHENIRAALGSMAHMLDHYLPECREKSLALTKLEEAMFWANAAIARRPE
ncbi:MAG: hypothetical protein ACKVWR_21780 [Acidimicrobiales bacterium]